MEPNRNLLLLVLRIWHNLRLLRLVSATTLIPVIAQAGLNFQTIKTFQSSTNDGSWPNAGVIEAGDGSLYGTTAYGGANGHGTVVGGASGYGTVFKVNRDGSGYEVLHNFGDVVGDGKYPFARLLQG